MATTVNNNPSGVQTRFTRRSRPSSLNDIPQVGSRNSATRRQANDEAMTSTTGKGAGNPVYLRPRRALEHVGSACNRNDEIMSCPSEVMGTLVDNGCDTVVNGENERHGVNKIGTQGDTKGKSGRQLRTMVNRLAPTPGFVDKNSLPADLMTRSRVRREASLNAAAKVNFILEPSSHAGRSMTDFSKHSKKAQGDDEYDEFGDEGYPVKPRGRPRLASISTNNSNFLRSPELLNKAAHAFMGNAHVVNSENSVALKHLHENSVSLKRFQEADGETYQAKRAKLDREFMKNRYEQNGDYSTIITERRFVKGKEVVDVGLQVRIPLIKPAKNHDSSIGYTPECTCRSSTEVDIPVKSEVSTYANGTLISIPFTKTHRLTPHVPGKPQPELAQGNLANRSKCVAGLNSRAMIKAILYEKPQPPSVQNVTKPARKLPPKKSYYEHGLSNTVPSKLKIPKINFAATSTSNFGGRKLVGNQKPSVWSKSGLVSHDGPKRTNGWFYLGSPIEKPYYYHDTKVMRKYYIGIKRNDEIIYVRDSVLLKSGPRRKDLPFVARVSGFWEEDDGPHAGEMMMSVLWYYRPEQTEMGMQPHVHGENEILASRHKDDNSVACIVDKCYVLSYPEYCRHRAAVKRSQDSRMSSATPVPPVETTRTTRERIPSTCDPKLVFFCRQIYDYRMGRILKNPLYV